MRILIAAHTHVGGAFVVGSHHLARELQALGHDTTHVSTAITPLHIGRLGEQAVRQRVSIARRFPRHHPQKVDVAIPFRLLPQGRTVLQRTGRVGRMQQRWLRGLNLAAVDLVLIDQPSLGWILDHTPGATAIYRPTDVYSDLSGQDRIRTMECSVLERSSGAIATSSVVHHHLVESLGATVPTTLIENGVEYPHFRQSLSMRSDSTESGTRRRRATYVGALDERFDWAGVVETARQLPEVDIELIGPTSAATPTVLPANIMLRGAVAYEKLPQALAEADVGLLPLSDHAGNTGRSPMKFYEYRAAGLVTVARRTPELARRIGDGVVLYDDPPDLSVALAEALDISPDREALSESAVAFDWTARVEEMLRFVDGCTNGGAGRGGPGRRQLNE